MWQDDTSPPIVAASLYSVSSAEAGYNLDNWKHFGMPWAVQFPDNRICTVFEANLPQPWDAETSHGAIRSNTSTDGVGDTWPPGSNARVVFEAKDNGHASNPAIVRMTDGRLVCAFMTDEDWPGISDTNEWMAHAEVKAVTSTDWGEIWSPPFVVASQRSLSTPRHCSWPGLIRLRDERLICTFNDGLGTLTGGRAVSESAQSVIINYGLGVETPLIEDHFDRLNLDWTPFVWGLLGTWEMSTAANYGNVFKGIALSIYEPAHAFRGDTAWTDYRVQADVRLEATTATAGVCLRDKDFYSLGQRFYECYIELRQGEAHFKFRLRYWDSGSSSWLWYSDYQLPTVTVPNPYVWHTIKVCAEGSTLSCYLDTDTEPKFTVHSTYWTDGMVGLRVDEGDASFDNVEVIDLRQ